MSSADDHLELAIFGKKRSSKNRARDIRVAAYKLAFKKAGAFESMVKITSWGSATPEGCQGKTSNSRNHSDYISRNNKLEVENEEGEVLSGKDEILSYFKQRDERFFDVPRFKGQRDTLHMVLSAPTHVNPEHVKGATRDFCKGIFGNHRYVFVLHEKHTDPKGGKENPHCHIDIECLSKDGESRLRVNREDLQHMREVYAVSLEKYGYEVNATPRFARGVKQKGKSVEVLGMEKREEENKKKGITTPVFTRPRKTNTPEVDSAIGGKIIRRRESVAKHYRSAADEIDSEKVPESKEFTRRLRLLADVISQGKEYKGLFENEKTNDIDIDR